MPDVDLSEFEKLSKPRRPPCALGALEGRLSDKDLAAFQGALAADPGHITNAAIAKWLASRNVDVHAQRVLSHRSGACNCPQNA
jgi:hypothetical protein